MVTALVLDYMSPILGALVFIGISAAIMSTMDSLINTASMTLVLDLLPPQQDEQKQLARSRMCTLLVTVVALAISMYVRSILEISWMASDIITTGVFVPLILGFFWRRGNHYGAMASMGLGFVYCTYNLLISFGLQLPSFWKPQSAQQVILGVVLSLAAYVGVSLLTPAQTEQAEAFRKLAGIGRREEKNHE